MNKGKFRNIKIRVCNAETSRKVQEKLFENGCFWVSQDNPEPCSTNAVFLFVNSRGHIGWDNDQCFFDEDDREAMLVSDILDYMPEWNGAGLPPVGCECEYDSGDGWIEVTVFGAQGDKFWLSEGGVGFLCYKCTENSFRPIRTEAEKQREADKAALIEMIKNTGCVDSLAEKILDAGFTLKADEQKPQ